MIELKLALDSNVFGSKKFCNWLLSQKEEKYLPVIAYMEYLHHHLQKGNTESMVDAFLKHMNISVVPFGKKEAVAEAKSSTINWNSSGNVRNYVIGITAISLGAKLVTNDKKHFRWMDDVITTDDVVERY